MAVTYLPVPRAVKLSLSTGGFAGPIAPMRDADQGTAARPGRRLPLISSADASANLAQLIEGLEISAKVRPS